MSNKHVDLQEPSKGHLIYPSDSQISLDVECEHDSIAFSHDGEVRRVLIIDKDPGPADAVAVELEMICELKKLREQKTFVSLDVDKRNHGLVQILRKGMGVLFHRMTDLISLRSNHFVYEPHLEVVFDVFKARKIIENDTFGVACHAYSKVEVSVGELEIQNQLVREIQAILKGGEFKKKLADRRKGIKRIRNAFRGVWRRCFARRARILIGRLDLEYSLNGNPESFHPLYSPQFPDRFLIEVFLDDRDRFNNNLRDHQQKGKFAEHLIEWGWKIECGSKRGWHLHCVFFFDASRVKSAWYQMELLGDLWVRLTEGRGTYFNPHQGSKEYRSQFIGEVRRGDEEAEKAYELFIEYLCKDDQVPVVKTTKKLQTFGVSRGKRHDNR